MSGSNQTFSRAIKLLQTYQLRCFVANKNDPLVKEVELLGGNSSFAHVRFPNGREFSTPTSDLAASPQQNEA